MASFYVTQTKPSYVVFKADLVKNTTLSNNLFLIGKLISLQLHVSSYLKTEFRGRGALVNKINKLQVYNSIAHGLCTVLCVHHPKASLHM